MAKVEGIKELTAKLRDRAAKASRDANVSVLVGFSAAHAIFVHEMIPKTLGQNVPRKSGLGVYWGPSQHGPKFLEAPARELGPELGKVVRAVVKKNGTVATGLVAAGMRLQAESQRRVPVEYGALRASAFTKLEK